MIHKLAEDENKLIEEAVGRENVTLRKHMVQKTTNEVDVSMANTKQLICEVMDSKFANTLKLSLTFVLLT